MGIRGLQAALLVPFVVGVAAFGSSADRGLSGESGQGVLAPEGADDGNARAFSRSNDDQPNVAMTGLSGGETLGAEFASALSSHHVEQTKSRAEWISAHADTLKDAGLPGQERADRLEDWRADGALEDVSRVTARTAAFDRAGPIQRAAVTARLASKSFSLARSALNDANWAQRQRRQLARAAEDASTYTASLRHALAQIRAALVSATSQLAQSSDAEERTRISAEVDRIRANAKHYMQLVREHEKREHGAERALGGVERTIKAAFTRAASYLAAGEMDSMIAAAEELLVKRDAVNEARATQALWEDLDMSGEQRAETLKASLTAAAETLQEAERSLREAVRDVPAGGAEVDVQPFLDAVKKAKKELAGRHGADDADAARAAEAAAREVQDALRAVQATLIVKESVIAHAVRITEEEHKPWERELQRLQALLKNHQYWARSAEQTQQRQEHKAAADRIRLQQLPPIAKRETPLREALTTLEEHADRVTRASRAASSLSRAVAGALFTEQLRSDAAETNSTASAPVDTSHVALSRVQDVWKRWHKQRGVSGQGASGVAVADESLPTGGDGGEPDATGGPGLGHQFANDDAILERLESVAEGSLPRWTKQNVDDEPPMQGPNDAQSAGTGATGAAALADTRRPETAAEVIAQADSDRNGKLDLSEFHHAVALLTSGSIAPRPAEVERMFKLADRDGDGELDASETQEWMDAEVLWLREGWWLRRINGMSGCELAGSCATTTSLTPPAAADSAALFRELARAALNVARSTNETQSTMAAMRDKIAHIAGVREPRNRTSPVVEEEVVEAPAPEPVLQVAPVPTVVPKVDELVLARQTLEAASIAAAKAQGAELEAVRDSAKAEEAATTAVADGKTAEEKVEVVSKEVDEAAKAKAKKQAQLQQQEASNEAREMEHEAEELKQREKDAVRSGAPRQEVEAIRKASAEAAKDASVEEAKIETAEKSFVKNEDAVRGADQALEDAEVSESSNALPESEEPFAEATEAVDVSTEESERADRAAREAERLMDEAALANIKASAAREKASAVRARAKAESRKADAAMEKLRKAEFEATASGGDHVDVPMAMYAEARDRANNAQLLATEAMRLEKRASDLHQQATALAQKSATSAGEAEALRIRAKDAADGAGTEAGEAERNAEQLGKAEDSGASGEVTSKLEELVAAERKTAADAEQARVIATGTRKRANESEALATKAERKASGLRQKARDEAEEEAAVREAAAEAGDLGAADTQKADKLAKRADATFSKASDASKDAQRLREEADELKIEAARVEREARKLREEAKAAHEAVRAFRGPAQTDARVEMAGQEDEEVIREARMATQEESISSELAADATEKAEKAEEEKEQAAERVRALRAAGASPSVVAAAEEAAHTKAKAAAKAKRGARLVEKEEKQSAEVAERESQAAQEAHAEIAEARTEQKVQEQEAEEEKGEDEEQAGREAEREVEGPSEQATDLESPISVPRQGEEEGSNKGEDDEENVGGVGVVTPESSQAANAGESADDLAGPTGKALALAARADEASLEAQRRAAHDESFADSLEQRYEELDAEADALKKRGSELREEGEDLHEASMTEDKAVEVRAKADAIKVRVEKARTVAVNSRRKADAAVAKAGRARREAEDAAMDVDRALRESSDRMKTAYGAAMRRHMFAAEVKKKEAAKKAASQSTSAGTAATKKSGGSESATTSQAESNDDAAAEESASATVSGGEAGSASAEATSGTAADGSSGDAASQAAAGGSVLSAAQGGAVSEAASATSPTGQQDAALKKEAASVRKVRALLERATEGTKKARAQAHSATELGEGEVALVWERAQILVKKASRASGSVEASRKSAAALAAARKVLSAAVAEFKCDAASDSDPVCQSFLAVLHDIEGVAGAVKEEAARSDELTRQATEARSILDSKAASLKRSLVKSEDTISGVEKATRASLRETGSDVWVRQPDALRQAKVAVTKIGRARSAFKQSLSDLEVAEAAVEEHFSSIETAAAAAGARIVWTALLGSAQGWLRSLNSTQAAPALQALVSEAETASDEAAAAVSKTSAQEETLARTAELAVDALLADLDEGSSAADDASALIVSVSADELELAVTVAMERAANMVDKATSKRERAVQSMNHALSAEHESSDAVVQLAEAKAAATAAATVEASVRRALEHAHTAATEAEGQSGAVVKAAADRVSTLEAKLKEMSARRVDADKQLAEAKELSESRAQIAASYQRAATAAIAQATAAGKQLVEGAEAARDASEALHRNQLRNDPRPALQELAEAVANVRYAAAKAENGLVSVQAAAEALAAAEREARESQGAGKPAEVAKRDQALKDALEEALRHSKILAANTRAAKAAARRGASAAALSASEQAAALGQDARLENARDSAREAMAQVHRMDEAVERAQRAERAAYMASSVEEAAPLVEEAASVVKNAVAAATSAESAVQEAVSNAGEALSSARRQSLANAAGRAAAEATFSFEAILSVTMQRTAVQQAVVNARRARSARAYTAAIAERYEEVSAVTAALLAGAQTSAVELKRQGAPAQVLQATQRGVSEARREAAAALNEQWSLKGEVEKAKASMHFVDRAREAEKRLLQSMAVAASRGTDASEAVKAGDSELREAKFGGPAKVADQILAFERAAAAAAATAVEAEGAAEKAEDKASVAEGAAQMLRQVANDAVEKAQKAAKKVVQLKLAGADVAEAEKESAGLQREASSAGAQATDEEAAAATTRREANSRAAEAQQLRERAETARARARAALDSGLAEWKRIRKEKAANAGSLIAQHKEQVMTLQREREDAQKAATAAQRQFEETRELAAKAAAKAADLRRRGDSGDRVAAQEAEAAELGAEAEVLEAAALEAAREAQDKNAEALAAKRALRDARKDAAAYVEGPDPEKQILDAMARAAASDVPLRAQKMVQAREAEKQALQAVQQRAQEVETMEKRVAAATEESEGQRKNVNKLANESAPEEAMYAAQDTLTDLERVRQDLEQKLVGSQAALAQAEAAADEAATVAAGRSAEASLAKAVAGKANALKESAEAEEDNAQGSDMGPAPEAVAAAEKAVEAEKASREADRVVREAEADVEKSQGKVEKAEKELEEANAELETQRSEGTRLQKAADKLALSASADRDSVLDAQRQASKQLATVQKAEVESKRLEAELADKKAAVEAAEATAKQAKAAQKEAAAKADQASAASAAVTADTNTAAVDQAMTESMEEGLSWEKREQAAQEAERRLSEAEGAVESARAEVEEADASIRVLELRGAPASEVRSAKSTAREAKQKLSRLQAVEARERQKAEKARAAADEAESRAAAASRKVKASVDGIKTQVEQAVRASVPRLAEGARANTTSEEEADERPEAAIAREEAGNAATIAAEKANDAEAAKAKVKSARKEAEAAAAVVKAKEAELASTSKDSAGYSAASQAAANARADADAKAQAASKALTDFEVADASAGHAQNAAEEDEAKASQLEGEQGAAVDGGSGDAEKDVSVTKQAIDARKHAAMSSAAALQKGIQASQQGQLVTKAQRAASAAQQKAHALRDRVERQVLLATLGDAGAKEQVTELEGEARVQEREAHLLSARAAALQSQYTTTYNAASDAQSEAVANAHKAEELAQLAQKQAGVRAATKAAKALTEAEAAEERADKAVAEARRKAGAADALERRAVEAQRRLVEAEESREVLERVTLEGKANATGPGAETTNPVKAISRVEREQMVECGAMAKAAVDDDMQLPTMASLREDLDAAVAKRTTAANATRTAALAAADEAQTLSDAAKTAKEDARTLADVSVAEMESAQQTAQSGEAARIAALKAMAQLTSQSATLAERRHESLKRAATRAEQNFRTLEARAEKLGAKADAADATATEVEQDSSSGNIEAGLQARREADRLRESADSAKAEAEEAGDSAQQKAREADEAWAAAAAARKAAREDRTLYESEAAAEGRAKLVAMVQEAAIREQYAAMKSQAMGTQGAVTQEAVKRREALQKAEAEAEKKAAEEEERVVNMQENAAQYDAATVSFGVRLAGMMRRKAEEARLSAVRARKAAAEEEARLETATRAAEQAKRRARATHVAALDMATEVSSAASGKLGLAVAEAEEKVNRDAAALQEAEAAVAKETRDEDVARARRQVLSLSKKAQDSARELRARRSSYHDAMDRVGKAQRTAARYRADQAATRADEADASEKEAKAKVASLSKRWEHAATLAAEAQSKVVAAQSALNAAQLWHEQAQAASDAPGARRAGAEVSRASEALRLARIAAADKKAHATSLADETRQAERAAEAASATAVSSRSEAKELRLEESRVTYETAEKRAAREASLAARLAAATESLVEAERASADRASTARSVSYSATRAAAKAERRLIVKRGNGASGDELREASTRLAELRRKAKEAAAKAKAAEEEADDIRDERKRVASEARSAHKEAVTQGKSAFESHVVLLDEVAAQRDDAAQTVESEAIVARKRADSLSMAASKASAAVEGKEKALKEARRRMSAASGADAKREAKQQLKVAEEKLDAVKQRAAEAAATAEAAEREALAAEARSKVANGAAQKAMAEVKALRNAGSTPVPPTTAALSALTATKEAAVAQLKSQQVAKRAAEDAKRASGLEEAASKAEAKSNAARRAAVLAEKALTHAREKLSEAKAQGDASEVEVARDRVAAAEAEVAETKRAAKMAASKARAEAADAAEAGSAAARSRAMAMAASERARDATEAAKESTGRADEDFLQSSKPEESDAGFDEGIAAVGHLQNKLAEVLAEYEERMSAMQGQVRSLTKQASSALEGAQEKGENTEVAAFARQMGAAAEAELESATEAWSSVEGVVEHMERTVASLERMLKIYGMSPAFRKHTGRMVVGKVEVEDTYRSKNWTYVEFRDPFEVAPVVVTTPEMYDSAPMALRVVNVTRRGFMVAPMHASPQGPFHRRQIVFYMAATPGRHALQDGTLIEVGRQRVKDTQISPDCGAELARQNSWHELRFSEAFPGSPTLLTQIQTAANGDSSVPKETAAPFLTVAVGHIGSSGARIALERGQSRRGTVKAAEEVGFIAIMQRTGSILDDQSHVVHFENFLSFPQVKGIARGSHYVGSRTFMGRDPVVLAHTATRANARGGWVRKQSASKWHHYYRLDNTNECGSRDLPEAESISVFMMTETGTLSMYEPLKTDDKREAALLDGFEQPLPEEEAKAKAKAEALPDATMEVGWARFRHTGIDPRFSVIRFKQEYRTPPLVFFLNDRKDAEPADIRIKKVTTKLVVAAIVEPPRFGGTHRNEEVPYLAIEPGTARLPDGTVVEAGEVETNATQYDQDCVSHGVKKRWERALFNYTFASAPAVVTRIQTMVNERAGPPQTVSLPFLNSAVQAIDKDGVDVALDRSRVREGGATPLRPERIAYVALQRGVGSFLAKGNKAVKYEFDVTPDLMRGLNQGCQHVGLRQLYEAYGRHRSPPLVLADKATHRSEEGGFMRYCGHHRWSHHWSVRLMIDKDNSCSPDRSHVHERASLAVFSETFVLRRKIPGEPVDDGIERSPLPADSPARMEASFAVMRDTWKTTKLTKVWFEKPFKQPPLVFIMPTHNDMHAVTIRVFRVSYEYMEVSLVAPPRSWRAAHHDQVVPYVAIEPGTHKLPDGSVIEAGVLDTRAQQHAVRCYNRTVASESTRTWEQVQFNYTFPAAPAVFTQIQTVRNEEMHPPRTISSPFLTTVTDDTTTNGVKVALERGHMGMHGFLPSAESVAYLAMEQKTSAFADDNTKDVRYQAFTVDKVDGCSGIDFTKQYEQHPVVMATLASRSSDEGGWPRICGNGWSPRHLSMSIEQDDMCGGRHYERPHNASSMALVLFSRPFTRILYTMEDDPLADAARIAMARKQAEMRRLLAKHQLELAAMQSRLAEEREEQKIGAADTKLVAKADVAEIVAKRAKKRSMELQERADTASGESLQAAAELRRAKANAASKNAKLDSRLAALEQANATATSANSTEVVDAKKQVEDAQGAASLADATLKEAKEKAEQRSAAAEAARLEASEAFLTAIELVTKAREARARAEAGSQAAEEEAKEDGSEVEAKKPARSWDPTGPGLQPVLTLLAEMREAVRKHVADGEQEMESAFSLMQFLRARLDAEGTKELDKTLGMRADLISDLAGSVLQEKEEGEEAWSSLYGSLEHMRGSVARLRAQGRSYLADPFFRSITGNMFMEKVFVKRSNSLQEATFVRFPRKFVAKPVVFATPTTQCGSGVALRVLNVTREGFNVVPMRAAASGAFRHSGMVIHYLAAMPGRHALQDGTLIEVGVEEVEETQSSPDCGEAARRSSSWHNLRFRNELPTPPALLVQTQSIENKDPSPAFVTVAVDTIDARGARIALERGQSRGGAVAKPERVGYFAMMQRARTVLDPEFHPVSFESFISFPQVRGGGRHYVGSRTSVGNEPVIFAHTASRHNPTGGWVRKASSTRWHHYFTLDNARQCGPASMPQYESLSVIMFQETGEYPLLEPLEGDKATNDALLDGLEVDRHEPPVTKERAEALGLPNPEEGDSGASLEVGLARFDNTNYEAKWTTIHFKQHYEKPPLVFFLNDRRDAEPADIRIKEVTTTYVVATIVEPPKFGGEHRHEEAYYLAVARGVQRLPDGTVIEAGEVKTNATQYDSMCVHHAEAKRWDSVNFAAPFSAAPSVITRVQTLRNERGNLPSEPSTPFLTTAVKDLSRFRMSLALERSRVDEGTTSSFAKERVAYIAFQRGVGSFKDSEGKEVSYEFDVTSAIMRGLNMGCQHIGLRRRMQGYGPPIVLADKATHNSEQGGFMRFCKYNRHSGHYRWSVRLFVDKDTSCSPDRSHTYERASLAVFSDTFVLRTATETRTRAQNYKALQLGPQLPARGPSRIESGWVHMGDVFNSGDRVHAWFRKPFKQPPLVFTMTTDRDWHPVDVRVLEVRHDYMVLSFIKPVGYGWPHHDQVIPYIAVEPGVHRLPDGTVLEAGEVPTKAQRFNRLHYRHEQTWDHMRFDHSFSKRPAVITEIQGAANERARPPVSNSRPWVTPIVDQVTGAGMAVALERAGVARAGAVTQPERVAYLAVEPRGGSFKADDGASIVWRAMAERERAHAGNGHGRHNTGCRMIGYGKSLPGKPLAVASLNSRTDQMGGWARSCGMHGSGVSIRIDMDHTNRRWLYLSVRYRGKLAQTRREIARRIAEHPGQVREKEQLERKRNDLRNQWHQRHNSWRERFWRLARRKSPQLRDIENRLGSSDGRYRELKRVVDNHPRKIRELRAYAEYLEFFHPHKVQDVSVLMFSKPFTARLSPA